MAISDNFRYNVAQKRTVIRTGGVATKIPKETLALAGEFAVASELCRRGIYAQLGGRGQTGSGGKPEGFGRGRDSHC